MTTSEPSKLKLLFVEIGSDTYIFLPVQFLAYYLSFQAATSLAHHTMSTPHLVPCLLLVKDRIFMFISQLRLWLSSVAVQLAGFALSYIYHL